MGIGTWYYCGGVPNQNFSVNRMWSAGSTISDFGGDHPAVICRGILNMQECRLSRNRPSETTPVIFGDILPAAVALQYVEWPDHSEAPNTVRLGGQPNLDEPVFFSDDTSLNVALTAGLADPEWTVRNILLWHLCKCSCHSIQQYAAMSVEYLNFCSVS